MADKKLGMSKLQVEFACREMEIALHKRRDEIKRVYATQKPKPPEVMAVNIADLIDTGVLVPNPAFKVTATATGYAGSIYFSDVFPNWRDVLNNLPGVAQFTEANAAWTRAFHDAYGELDRQYALAKREIILGDVQEALRILREFETAQ